MEEGARWERGCLEGWARVAVDCTRGSTTGAQELGLGAGSAGQGEGGGAGRAAGGSPARSGRAGPRGARRRARGAEGVCGRGGLVPKRDAALPAPSASRRWGAGQWAPEAPLKFGSLKRTEFPGRKSVLARSGICWSRLAFLPFAADPTLRRRLANFFGRLAASQISGGRSYTGGGQGCGRGVRGGELCEPQRPARGGLCVVGSGQWSEKGFAGRREV